MRVICCHCGCDVVVPDVDTNVIDFDFMGLSDMVSCDDCLQQRRSEDAEKSRKDRKASELPRILEAGFTEFMINWDMNKGNLETYQKVYSGRNGSMFICGETGTCKTRSVSVWGADYVARHPKAFVIFVNYEQFADKVRELSTNNKGSLTKYLHQLSHCDLLVFDEFGAKQQETDFVVAKLESVINERYQRAFKKTWITSNYPLNVCAQRLGVDRGEKIMHRVSEMCGQPIVAEAFEVAK